MKTGDLIRDNVTGRKAIVIGDHPYRENTILLLTKQVENSYVTLEASKDGWTVISHLPSFARILKSLE